MTAAKVIPMERAEMEVKTTKEQIQELIHAGEETQTSIAREAGLSSSAISQWLHGTYKGDNTALENKLTIWWESREIRARAVSALPMAPQFILTTTAERIKSVLSYAQMAGDLAVIYGGAGVGKTTACREYRRNNPSVWIATMKPSTRSIMACLEEIARAIRIEAPKGCSAARISREIAGKIENTNGLLIIDEAQHLTLSALEEVRSIHDATGTALVLCGNEFVYSRLTGKDRSENLAQLFSRIGKRLRLNRPSEGDIAAVMEAFELRGNSERKKLQDLGARPGALRNVVKSVRLASMFAAGAGESLNLNHIVAAWKDLAGEEVAC